MESDVAHIIGSVAKQLGHWTCNSEALSSSPTVIAS